jgi:hypothetical protein
MTAPTIPFKVLQSAVEALVGDATKTKKNVEDFYVSYESVSLVEAHSHIPTLYKIKLVLKDNSYTFFGVWTEKGQRLEIY